jgi:hypothetical protein
MKGRRLPKFSLDSGSGPEWEKRIRPRLKFGFVFEILFFWGKPAFLQGNRLEIEKSAW